MSETIAVSKFPGVASLATSSYAPPPSEALNKKISKVWNVVDESSEILSSTTNVVEAIAEPSFSEAISRLGLFTNAIEVINNASNCKQGINDYQVASKISDSEGKILASSRIGSSATLFSSAALMLGALSADSLEIGGRVSASLYGVGEIIMGVGSAMSMGISVYRLLQLGEFRAKLSGSFETVEKSENILQKLKEMLSLTPSEIGAISDQIEQTYPDRSAEDRQVLFDQKCADLAQVKLRFFKRRSSLKSAQSILQNVDTLLKQLKCPEMQGEAIKNTKELLQIVKRDTTKKIVFYVFNFFISALTFLAFVGSTILSSGTLPLIFFAISSALGLGAMAVNGIATRYFQKPAIVIH